MAEQSMRERPTDEEFAELKRNRDEGIRKVIAATCAELGLDPNEAHVHSRDLGAECYCACPDGPCQHTWDGPEYTEDNGCMSSTTCSRCGAVAFYHDMGRMP